MKYITKISDEFPKYGYGYRILKLVDKNWHIYIDLNFRLISIWDIRREHMNGCFEFHFTGPITSLQTAIKITEELQEKYNNLPMSIDPGGDRRINLDSDEAKIEAIMLYS